MSSTQTTNEPVTGMVPTTTVDLKVEIIVIPVADVDRAKRFYEGLGWRVDGDYAYGDEWRLVQLTPPGSPCSIMIGKGDSRPPYPDRSRARSSSSMTSTEHVPS